MRLRDTQIDDLKRALYADPTLSPEDREAAELALEAMRRPQPTRSLADALRAYEATDEPPKRPWPPTRPRSAVLGSFRSFMSKRARPIVRAGYERWAPHDTDAKRRIKTKIEAHTEATEPGKAWGRVTPKIRRVAMCLLDRVNSKDGRCFPSLETIASDVRERFGGTCSIGTVKRALEALVAIGVLEPWFNRIKTIFEEVADFFGGGKRKRVVRTSNGYRFVDPDPEPAPQGAPAAQPVDKPVSCSNADLRQGTLFPRKKDSSLAPAALSKAVSHLGEAALTLFDTPQTARAGP
jgi:hypothetical protein